MAKSIREQLFGNSKDYEEVQIVLDGLNRATDAVIQATKFILHYSTLVVLQELQLFRRCRRVDRVLSQFCKICINRNPRSRLTQHQVVEESS